MYIAANYCTICVGTTRWSSSTLHSTLFTGHYAFICIIWSLLIFLWFILCIVHCFVYYVKYLNINWYFGKRKYVDNLKMHILFNLQDDFNIQKKNDNNNEAMHYSIRLLIFFYFPIFLCAEGDFNVWYVNALYE